MCERDVTGGYQPSTVLSRWPSGQHRPSCVSCGGKVRLLLESGTVDIPFAQLAELHLAARDAWTCYFEQLALLTPGCVSRLLRVETIEGLTATASLERFRIASPGGHDPNRWLHMLQPAWSLDPLWVRHATVRLRQYSEPHEVPLTHIDVPDVAEASLSGDRWNCLFNANVRGGPLRINDQGYGWGVGMHAWAELQIPLPPAVRSFRTLFGLDDVAGHGGCARAQVLVSSANKPQMLFESEHLVGSAAVLDTGELELSTTPDSQQPQTLILRADPAHEGRPAGADPLNIRDTLDWLHPRLTIEPERLQTLVASRFRHAVPAWRGWRIEATGAVPIAFENHWEATDPRRQSYRMLVCPRVPWLILSRKFSANSNFRHLVLSVSRPPDTHAAQLMVRVNGAESAQFEVPIRHNAADPEPLVVALPDLDQKKVDLEIVLLPLGPKAMLDWQAISLVAESPNRHFLLDEKPAPDQLIQMAEGSLPIAVKDPLHGSHAWELSGKAPSHVRWEFTPVAIENMPRLGAYRFICFAWRGTAPRVCVELGHDHRWGPDEHVRDRQAYAFRYDAGSGKPSHDAARRVGNVPENWTMTVRDLYGDFREFSLTGIGLSTPDGGTAQFDTILLARSREEISAFQAQLSKSP